MSLQSVYSCICRFDFESRFEWLIARMESPLSPHHSVVHYSWGIDVNRPWFLVFRNRNKNSPSSNFSLGSTISSSSSSSSSSSFSSGWSTSSVLSSLSSPPFLSGVGADSSYETSTISISLKQLPNQDWISKASSLSSPTPSANFWQASKSPSSSSHLAPQQILHWLSNVSQEIPNSPLISLQFK